jgi:methyltransferase (TIGR00027 family)
MKLRGVNETARSAAMLRALHLLVDGEPKIFRDDLALPLSGIEEEQALSLWKSGVLPPTSGWVLRNRYTEDLLAQMVEIEQYVILGAGLDSFACRNAGRLGRMRVYEVDDPPMQAWKRHRLEELRIETPPELSFAPCDFETMRISQALDQAGFVPTRPALVAWLGVTQYLTAEAIHSTLEWAASLATRSHIVPTHVVPGDEASARRKRFAKMGIAFETFFTPEEIERLLRQAGFDEVVHLDPTAAQQEYFQGRDDGLEAPTVERLVTGIV